jgi:hypothetical protein
VNEKRTGVGLGWRKSIRERLQNLPLNSGRRLEQCREALSCRNAARGRLTCRRSAVREFLATPAVCSECAGREFAVGAMTFAHPQQTDGYATRRAATRSRWKAPSGRGGANHRNQSRGSDRGRRDPDVARGHEAGEVLIANPERLLIPVTCGEQSDRIRRANDLLARSAALVEDEDGRRADEDPGRIPNDGEVGDLKRERRALQGPRALPERSP